MITAGIDAGAATTKVVLLRENKVAGSRVTGTSFDFPVAAEKIFGEVLAANGISKENVSCVCATGYGRNRIMFADRTISEITAQAKGVHHLFPAVRGIIDIGGQDSKIIVVKDGRVTDFLMNDKCAAGTGKFLEYTAKALEIGIGDIAGLALAADRPADITSMCTVFAESEVISLRTAGIRREDIAAGLIRSIGQRIASMAKKMGLSEQIAFVGGVARNAAMRAVLEEELATGLYVPDDPQVTAALGAALAAQGG